MEKFIRNSFLNLIKYINGLSKPATNFIDKWIPVIHPDGSKIILFEIYFLLIQIMQLYYIPMFVSFDEISIYPKTNSLFSFFFHTLPFISFIVELILNFFTGYYDG